MSTAQDLKADIELVRSAQANMVKVGPVAMMDPVKGYRLKLGEGADGQPYLSPWYPHPETGKTSVPLKIGQVVGVVNPNGDPRQGFLLRGGYSDENGSPNDDMAANVFEDAGVRVAIASGKLVVSIGNTTHTISGSGIETTVDDVDHRVTGAGVATQGGAVTHDGKNIGSQHVHGGVARGGALTDPPA